MKKLNLIIMVMVMSLVAMAQSNKPEGGEIGIGFGVQASPFQQNIYITYMLNQNLEIGGTLSLAVTHTRNSTFDSTVVETTGGLATAQEEMRTTTSQATFKIAPTVRYHFNTKNNLDVYTGGMIPIGVASSTKTVKSDIVTTSNYNSMGSITTTGPTNITIGGAVLLGCRFFFMKNLALGAETNLGALASIGDGNNTTTTAASNSGSNNPSTFSTSESTKTKVKSETVGYGFLYSISASLTWYFGTGNKSSK